MNLRIIFLFKRFFFSHFLPLNNTQICNMQSKLGTCFHRKTQYLKSTLLTKGYSEQLWVHKQKTTFPICLLQACHIHLSEFAQRQDSSSFYRSELWTCRIIPVSYSQQKTKNLNTKLGHICPSSHLIRFLFLASSTVFLDLVIYNKATGRQAFERWLAFVLESTFFLKK